MKYGIQLHSGQKICIWPKAGLNLNAQYKKYSITKADMKTSLTYLPLYNFCLSSLNNNNNDFVYLSADKILAH